VTELSSPPITLAVQLGGATFKFEERPAYLPANFSEKVYTSSGPDLLIAVIMQPLCQRKTNKVYCRRRVRMKTLFLFLSFLCAFVIKG
jgi:hypothetical protein